MAPSSAKANIVVSAVLLLATLSHCEPVSGNLYLVPTEPTTDPTNHTGCLGATGRLTLDDCATFTYEAETWTGGNLVSAAAGPCTVNDESQPTNEDSVYGKDQHALFCSQDAAPDTQFYTINGLDGRLCQGNLRCAWDIPITGKPAPGAQVPVWPFLWGSQQMGVPEGHTQVALFLQ
ncbi:hypothetical protein DL762_001787 [Monosporascus cannonballus]|uniref:Uncharacterized protein n=1 Tax=Monosporascus cannonballus TaxID=155416 RepID=A0ABY0HJF4_9PEZI|nr:hypothetical protein DL762_001787 [Monosporascus cannonballus]RYO93791.1 hypothetical protein DL763_004276 [Monosporascus cannonballus]